jgi:membrane-bound lytic murein transglycosylase B
VLLAPQVAQVSPDGSPEIPAPTWAPPASAPLAAESPGAGNQTRVDADWAEQTAEATGIPVRALVAYAGAAMFKAEQMPECGLSWSTLAGVGKIESDHGRHGGSSLGADGTATPPIFGIALDGGNTAHIPDSDDGAIDGDADFDRAVGPMQLIPQTWRNWHTDGGGDGVEDPQNIDDAVAAAANYLCRSSIDMDTEAGWRAAVSAYNSSDTYLSNVAAAAVAYTEAADG